MQTLSILANYSVKTISIFATVPFSTIVTTLLVIKTLLTYEQFLAKQITKVTN